MEILDEATQRKDVQRRLKLASFLCLIFLVAEVVGGLISGSLAVLSDAAHLTSDLMSFLFAVAAAHLASMEGTQNYVSIIYGFAYMLHNEFMQYVLFTYTKLSHNI